MKLLAYAMSCLTVFGVVAVVTVSAASFALLFQQDEYGAWSYAACAIVYAWASAVGVQQTLVRAARLPRRRVGGACDDAQSAEERRSPRPAPRECDPITWIPLLFASSFATRALWFASRATSSHPGACAPGAMFVTNAASRNYWRDASSTNPCNSAYVGSASRSEGETIREAHASTHAGEAAVLSRLGNMLLFTAFSLLCWYIDRTASAGGDDAAAGDAMHQTQRDEDASSRTVLATFGSRHHRRALVHNGGGSAAAEISGQICASGANMANSLTIICNAYFWCFEIILTAVRLAAGRVEHAQSNATYLCTLGRLGNVENISVALMFVVLALALATSSVRLLRLNSLAALDIALIDAMKRRVAWMAAMCSALFLLKAAAFLFTPLTGYGFGGKTCSVLYPFFFYPIPEVTPALLVVALMSPDRMLRSISAWRTVAVCGVRCLGAADDDESALEREADDCVRGLGALVAARWQWCAARVYFCSCAAALGQRERRITRRRSGEGGNGGSGEGGEGAKSEEGVELIASSASGQRRAAGSHADTAWDSSGSDPPHLAV